MYAQNCSLLPNKKQPAFNSSLPHNVGLLRNFSSQSFPKFDSSTHPSVNIRPSCNHLNSIHHPSRTTSIMDFIYTFNDSSRMKIRETSSNKAISAEKSRHNCKQLISHYNTVTQIPCVSSHLVGGFVGSKSQLGRRPTQGFGVGLNMWDIIRELLGVFGSTSANILDKENIRKRSFIGKKCPGIEKLNSQATPTNMSHNSNGINNRQTKIKDAHGDQKQSYADVAKIKLELPLMQEISSTNILDKLNSQMECNSVTEHLTMCTESENRNRITSECSIDSEDSFIVFECCEGDNMSIADDYSTSDDDGVMDFQTKHKESCLDHDYASLKRFDSTKDEKLPRKKVQFAKGKDLTKVHPMVTWDYAYRAARKGQWEMLARDSARFRYRIASTETVLIPILDPAHREAIFQQRFAHSETGT